jgi:hypothetical protein
LKWPPVATGRRSLDPLPSKRTADESAALACTVSAVELTITWDAQARTETDGDRVFVERAEGLQPADLEQLQATTDLGSFSVRDGSVGKGAAGPGVAVVFEIAEHVVNDVASLIALGAALRAAIKWVSERRKKPPAIISPEALAALAADHAHGDLAGTYYIKTVPLNVSEGVGTDERDVWAACFDQPEAGVVHVIFISPSGRVLGHVRVPAEIYIEGASVRRRSEAELREWWTDSG